MSACSECGRYALKTVEVWMKTVNLKTMREDSLVPVAETRCDVCGWVSARELPCLLAG